MIDPSAPAVRLAIFTDFDGTLVELAETPDAVEMPRQLADQLVRTAEKLESALAIVTGRPVEDIDRYLDPIRLPVAGSHGAQRRRADGSFEDAGAAGIRIASEIAQFLEPLAMANPDLILEPKAGAVALHYRQAPQLAEDCRRAMEEAVAAVEGFTIVPGKMVFEARATGVDKGAAVRAFMLEEPFAGRIPVFLGDDTTDEDGFRAVQELGGVGIKLGEGDTSARMRIADIASVHALLRGLADAA
ncbi:trehalose-phosphatase [Arsenicitalea aurantiaca]|uniref:Trehalose 6-phosphate phosphatase n=2 Tax=Arsenicitalea aurantiaca TaxID=1783274 RepID=A0A433XM96_9HYPH|nr:trehalose-phosphatase [Arsenicitalea aurantiaca]